jgi:hypothetical protein
MSTKGPAILNTIRTVVDEFGGSDALANTLCDRVGDVFLDALADQQSEYRPEDPPPRRLGHTELEAAMRWCPHVREVTPLGKGPKDAQVGNRYIDRDGSAYTNPAGCACTAITACNGVGSMTCAAIAGSAAGQLSSHYESRAACRIEHRSAGQVRASKSICLMTLTPPPAAKAASARRHRQHAKESANGNA